MVMVTRDPDRYRIWPGEGYDGVVRVVADDSYGTGTLLYGGRAVLTSAHVVEDAERVTVHFSTVDGAAALSGASLALHPEYDAVDANNDMALVWLSQPAPLSAARSALYRQDDERGQTTTLVGYGLTGEGDSGYDDSPRTSHSKHLAENRFDVTGDELKQALGGGINWWPRAESQLILDFDDGSQAHDALGLLAGYDDIGLGAREGMIAPGDSGGPAFIGDKVAGVATYAASLTRNGLSPDVNDAFDSSFGEVAGFQRVSYYQRWIDQSLREADDQAPSRADQVVTRIIEGDEGTQLAYFLVEFRGQRERPDQWVSVDYATRDGSATAGEDYLAVADTLVLYPGESQAVIPVEVIGDNRVEPDETFFLDVFNPVGGEFADGLVTLTAVRTIVDDDIFLA
ncbi:Calx-beta domain-containing protein [Halomonas pacifica]|uniref:Trypsin-like serine protease n=1 Tax=Bisbaumannia pacifica TaxID=77098 RepID=A0A510XC92_9GAMM|nr:Calx-beta domain-containing protein [Halomonas pacifica]MBH8581164.1 trypsin-like serine protease [Halomonas pacifica]MDC8803653.1 Calx-beta domain-containing protein [Halomonas pacifica]GEK48317.1 hypothetical protein HPA02_26000 [Halomonas pacifica]